jgi:hypothetical protein
VRTASLILRRNGAAQLTWMYRENRFELEQTTPGMIEMPRSNARW